MFGWHRFGDDRSCKLIDIRYYEIEVLHDVEHDEDGSKHDYVRERVWFVDEYGGKQGFDAEYLHADHELGSNNPFYPYYQCQSCLRFLRSWEEAKIHVGDDEDVDEPVIQMINDYSRRSK